MAKVQAYVSDEIVYKINKIVERRRAEGAKSTDVSFSSISTMLLELGLRVHGLRWSVKSQRSIRLSLIRYFLNVR